MNKKFIKLIVVILLAIFWTNCLYPINIVHAKELENVERKNTKKEEQGIQPSDNFAENLLFSGTTKTKQDKAAEPVGAGEAVLMLIPNVFIMIAKVITIVADKMVSTFVDERVVAYPGTNSGDYINDPKYKDYFTLDKLFFGDISILNANFFDFDSTKTDLNTLIKINIAKWYVIMSGITLILLLRSNDLFSHKYGFSLCGSKNSSKACRYKKNNDECFHIFSYGFCITYHTNTY